MTHRRQLKFVVVLIIIMIGSALPQSLSYKPGGGIHLFSEQEQWKLRLLGYVQSTYTVHAVNENEAVSNEFYIRRARLDFIFDYKDRYQIFVELDARGKRTEMVLAKFDIRYFQKHKLQIGKYITPFSPENTRSSRSLSTVERYSGLNSMFLLPALDTQYGVMFHGEIHKFNYFLSVTNGNGAAALNIRENNNAKDFQGRLVYRFNSQMHVGGSVNYSREEAQRLMLVDHTFNPFNAAQIRGRRFGYLFDFEYRPNFFSLRGEVFQYHFSEALSEEQQIRKFFGGYGEAGYFLFGNKTDGLQLLGRLETAQYRQTHFSLEGPSKMYSFILGNNWYKDDIFRLQINLIYELADKNSALQNTRFTGRDSAFEILTMLQLKF